MAEYIINSEDYALGMATIPYLRDEIVRCRDCKRYELPQPKNGWNGYCMTNEHDTVPDGFCAWGERRGE